MSEYYNRDIYSVDTGVSDSFVNKLKRAFTSALLLMTAYLITFSVNHYFTGMLLLSFNYNPEITFNDFHNLPFHYSYWTKEKITIIYSGGPILALFLGLIFYIVMRATAVNSLKLFLFWLSICFINVFLGLLVFSPFGIGRYDSELYKYFAIVASWWRIGGIVFVPLAFLSLFVSIALGYLIRNQLLRFSFSSRLLKTIKGKNSVIMQFYIIPVMLAAPVIISLTTFESIITHFFLMLNLIFISFGMFLRNEFDFSSVRATKADVLNKLPIVELLLVGTFYMAVFIFLK